MTKYSCIQNHKLYGNISVFAPNGQLMFRCNKKKANWYLKRNLAKYLDLQQTLLQLLFEPHGLGYSEADPALLEIQNNICCCCGSKNSLHKSYIVPKQYLLLMDLQFKSRHWDNLALLCCHCSTKWEIHRNKCSQLLVKLNDAPINGTGLVSDKEFRRIKSAAYALIQEKNTLPSQIKKQKLDIISQYLGHNPSPEEIKTLSEIKDIYKNNYRSHAQLVMEKIANQRDFSNMWKHWFVKCMRPNYLPEHLKKFEADYTTKLR